VTQAHKALIDDEKFNFSAGAGSAPAIGRIEFLNLPAATGICDPIRMIALCPRRSERKIALAVMLRLTAMDVCCGPPRSFSAVPGRLY
jgi:hypothetical protein